MNVLSVLEALGRGVGGMLAPVAAEASLIRGAAVFHPDGVVIRATVTAIAAEGPLGALGQALKGPALVRFSGALWRAVPGRDMRDVLGAAVRFAAGTAHAQDLLLATFRHLWQVPIAPLLTDPRDFLANEYHAVLPFHVPGADKLYTFDMLPEGGGAKGKDKYDRLDQEVRAGSAALRLVARGTEPRAATTPIARISLVEQVPTPAEGLRFDPFRDGAGIEPAGFLNAVRAAVYPASQLGRALARGGRP